MKEKRYFLTDSGEELFFIPIADEMEIRYNYKKRHSHPIGKEKVER